MVGKFPSLTSGDFDSRETRYVAAAYHGMTRWAPRDGREQKISGSICVASR